MSRRAVQCLPVFAAAILCTHFASLPDVGATCRQPTLTGLDCSRVLAYQRCLPPACISHTPCNRRGAVGSRSRRVRRECFPAPPHELRQRSARTIRTIHRRTRLRSARASVHPRADFGTGFVRFVTRAFLVPVLVSTLIGFATVSIPAAVADINFEYAGGTVCSDLTRNRVDPSTAAVPDLERRGLLNLFPGTDALSRRVQRPRLYPLSISDPCALPRVNAAGSVPSWSDDLVGARSGRERDARERAHPLGRFPSASATSDDHHGGCTTNSGAVQYLRMDHDRRRGIILSLQPFHLSHGKLQPSYHIQIFSTVSTQP